MAVIIRLDRMMADRKISSNRLAEQIGLTPTMLSRIKTGKISGMKFSTLELICRALDCAPGDILEIVPDSNEEESG